MNRSTESPASGRALIVIALVGAALLGSCSVGRGDNAPDASNPDPSGLPSDLAEPARPPTEPPATAPSTAAPTAPAAASTSTPTVAGGSGTTSSTLRSAATVPVSRTTLVNASDARGDHGAAAGYADLISLRIETGGDRIRFTVEVAADVPATLTGREVVGLGIDIYRGTEAESAFQLFADGGEPGWRAFLQGPSGFVEYPGTFEVGDRRIVFDVPSSELPDPHTAAFAVFLDRSSGTTPRVVTEDHLPELGKIRANAGSGGL